MNNREERTKPDSETARLVVDDAAANNETSVPSGFKIVGRIVNWNQSPSFTDAAVLWIPHAK